ncbi:hypothetical protein RRG08_006823 [Elysia crispata]|uniref:Uncharacterized protein n=1 Tax=Elysia crispata TaxID=231223 RepID=A0AAE1AY55_9GAST|nr:hypothetical protein RRG08_006823 [Elysia crispata]
MHPQFARQEIKHNQRFGSYKDTVDLSSADRFSSVMGPLLIPDHRRPHDRQLCEVHNKRGGKAACLT